MGRFDSQIATAKRLIEKNGQPVIWQTIPDSTSNTSTPWKAKGPVVPVNHQVTICFLPVGRVNSELLKYFGATEVPTGTIYGLMGAVTFDLTVKDVVIRDGQVYRITAIDTLSPNGQKLLHTIQFDA